VLAAKAEAMLLDKLPASQHKSYYGGCASWRP